MTQISFKKSDLNEIDSNSRASFYTINQGKNKKNKFAQRANSFLDFNRSNNNQSFNDYSGTSAANNKTLTFKKDDFPRCKSLQPMHNPHNEKAFRAQ